MQFHYEVIHNNFEGRYNLIYTDTDSIVYVVRHYDMSGLDMRCEDPQNGNSMALPWDRREKGARRGALLSGARPTELDLHLMVLCRKKQTKPQNWLGHTQSWRQYLSAS